MHHLGKIVSVPLREIWANEASDFTPWLASEDGLALLGAVLGLELELVDVEANVGSYKADIVARVAGDVSMML